MDFRDAIKVPGIYSCYCAGQATGSHMLVTSDAWKREASAFINGVVYYYGGTPEGKGIDLSTTSEPAMGIVNDPSFDWIKTDHLELRLVLKTENSNE